MSSFYTLSTEVTTWVKWPFRCSWVLRPGAHGQHPSSHPASSHLGAEFVVSATLLCSLVCCPTSKSGRYSISDNRRLSWTLCCYFQNLELLCITQLVFHNILTMDIELCIFPLLKTKWSFETCKLKGERLWGEVIQCHAGLGLGRGPSLMCKM